jgi:hypothetical protein
MQNVSDWKNKTNSPPTPSGLVPVSNWKSTQPAKEKKPSILGSIVRAPIRLLADMGTNLVNAGQVAIGREETQPFSGKFLGEVKGLGKIDITKSPFEKENLKVILNSASTGAEIASYLTAAGAAKKTVAGLTARGVLASKATFAEWVVENFPKLAKEGFLQGIAYTAGSQGRENVATGKPFSGTQAVKDVAFSTIGNVTIPAVARSVFGTSTKRILNARETERAIADAKILGRPIPEVGVPSAKYMTESGRTLPAPRTPGQIPIELPGKGLLESQEKVRKFFEVPTPAVEAPKVTAPKVKKGLATVKEFTQQKVTPAPDSTPTSAQAIPKAENVLQKDVERMADEVEGFEPGTFIEWSNTIRQLDPEEVMNVAMGGEKKIPNNIPSNAYLSIAKNIAEETGDVKMVKELASSDVASKAGQGLVSSRLTTAGNIVDDLRGVVLQKIRNKKLDTTKLTREQGALFERVKTNLRQFSKGTKQDIDNIINSLICK